MNRVRLLRVNNVIDIKYYLFIKFSLKLKPKFIKLKLIILLRKFYITLNFKNLIIFSNIQYFKFSTYKQNHKENFKI